MKQDTMLYQDRLGTRGKGKLNKMGGRGVSRSACCKHYVANSVEHSTEDGMTWCEKRASFWRNLFTYMNDHFTKTGSGQHSKTVEKKRLLPVRFLLQGPIRDRF
jgi:hypothetical protein